MVLPGESVYRGSSMFRRLSAPPIPQSPSVPDIAVLCQPPFINLFSMLCFRSTGIWISLTGTRFETSSAPTLYAWLLYLLSPPEVSPCEPVRHGPLQRSSTKV